MQKNLGKQKWLMVSPVQLGHLPFTQKTPFSKSSTWSLFHKRWRSFTTKTLDKVNQLTPGTFCKKMCFLDILVVFRLDLCQNISFNLAKNVFATRQLPFLAWHRVLQHFNSGIRRNQNFEILDEKGAYVFRLFDFWDFVFLAFPFSLFLFFLLQWLTF